MPRQTVLKTAVLFCTLTTCALQCCAIDNSPKRAPSGFLGMRGKKSDPNAYNNLLDKRAPLSGFHGMRGKKDQDLASPLEYYEKRAPSLMAFTGVRGKKDANEIQDLEDIRQDLEYDEKRAPSSGFHGMRGKKDYFNDDAMFEDEKRMGFLGMRGKKERDDYFDLADEDGDFDGRTSEEFDAFKRAPSSGFHGMRGKKAPSSVAFYGSRGKKGPSSSAFFGMRGKKAPSSGFLGMRGKKAPSSGFMGMRGKKEDYNGQDINQLLYYLNGDNEFREKRYQINNIKKTPSGFLGMRGKKNWTPVELNDVEDIIREVEGADGAHDSQVSPTQ